MQTHKITSEYLFTDKHPSQGDLDRLTLNPESGKQ